MTSKKPASLGVFANKREFVMRLVLAELIARPGEGPLTPRFARPAAGITRSSAVEQKDVSTRGST